VRNRMLSVFLLLALLTAALAAPAFASEEHMCAHEMNTVESLQHCVHHALEMGHITNADIANALQAKLDGAQAALDRGQPDVAINLLNAFVNQVQAQAGVHIDPMHAEHMIMHAQMVIMALAS
jgi:hypothetical protein